MVWIAAIIVIILFFVFPKQMFGLLGFLVVIICGIGLYFWQGEAQKQKEKDRVLITASYSLESCSEEYPIFLSIKNTSNRTVNETSWDWLVKRPGHSTNIANWSNPSSDRILEPGYGVTYCYAVPSLRGDFDETSLVYGVKNKYINFAK